MKEIKTKSKSLPDIQTAIIDEIPLGMTVKQQAKAIFQVKAFRRLSILILLWISIGNMPSIFMTSWGAEFFAGCTAYEKETDDCTFDYVSFNFYDTLFTSINGIVSFTCGGLVGRGVLFLCTLSLFL